MTKPLGQLSQTEKSEKPEKRETYWTPTEKESLSLLESNKILSFLVYLIFQIVIIDLVV